MRKIQSGLIRTRTIRITYIIDEVIGIIFL